MGEEDEYACVNRAQLKIKDNSGVKKKKKKKHSKETEKAIENEVKEQIKKQTVKDTKTKAELAFLKMQEKMVTYPPTLKQNTLKVLSTTLHKVQTKFSYYCKGM